MKKILLVYVLMFILPFKAVAQEETDDFTRLVQNQDSVKAIPVTVTDADSAYIRGDYLTAIDIYTEVMETKGVSATLCMNIGNSYFKLDEIAQAILWYERAYLLDPSDDDVKFNLELARTKTVDKVTPKNQLFIVVWFNNLVATLDVNTWAVLTLLFFFIAAVMSGVFLLARKITAKKISFAFSLFFFVFSVLSFIFASTQRNNILNRETAVILSPSVTGSIGAGKFIMPGSAGMPPNCTEVVAAFSAFFALRSSARWARRSAALMRFAFVSLMVVSLEVVSAVGGNIFVSAKSRIGSAATIRTRTVVVFSLEPVLFCVLKEVFFMAGLLKFSAVCFCIVSKSINAPRMFLLCRNAKKQKSFFFSSRTRIE